MAVRDAQQIQVVEILEPDRALDADKTATLVKSEHLHVIRLVVPAGKQLGTHKASGELTAICVQGRVQFFVDGYPHPLSAGQFLYLPACLPHAVRADEDAIVLLSIVTAPVAKGACVDPVEEASRESFPASDPPSYTPITGP